MITLETLPQSTAQLKQNEIKEIECDLIGPNKEFLWTIRSLLELNDVRIQIKRSGLSGYRLFYKGKDDLIYTIEIFEDGKLADWPEGFYDTYENQLNELLDLN